MERKVTKLKYEDAKINLIEIDCSDVITTSGQAMDSDGNYDDKGWT